MNVSAFKRADIYKSDKATMDRLLGDAEDLNIPGSVEEGNAKRLREGITHDTSNEHIIVWEVYERTDEGKWRILTFCPHLPEVDLRDPMELPYEHGMAPFVDFP